jgi:hypothetical protein
MSIFETLKNAILGSHVHPIGATITSPNQAPPAASGGKVPDSLRH